MTSTPAYPEKQAFVAHLIRALETSNPEFAWIQFLFVRSDYRAALVRLKNAIHASKVRLSSPQWTCSAGRRRNGGSSTADYDRLGRLRMKKVDDIVTKPTVTLAIQGMWVSDDPDSIDAPSPFDHWIDEHTALPFFRIATRGCSSSSWTGGWCEDISKYLDGYTRSRSSRPRSS